MARREATTVSATQLQNGFAPEQNDALVPKTIFGFLCALQPKRFPKSLAGKVAGHYSHDFPSKILPPEDGLFFFLRKSHASYKKAGLATVSAFRTYGRTRDTLREGMNHYEP